MISKSLTETAAIAREFASRLEPATSGATIVALSGELGSGKTTFAKSFAAAFGVFEDDVTSPTFVIEKRFTIDASKVGRTNWKTLIHIDAYRLESAADVEKLHWNETVADPSNLILVEWPERIGDALPANAIRIKFSHIDGSAEGEREISFK
ncbi:MAG: tRNA (adenosine(37)-N6)-threonylcarbamoyltransferase complex ATPase subunit type 1 TsaE [bacterium]|nr:tRNA (adenosine(37)-N6)-threonylcarbamoyltransferase complex ATPase subunit type 1 TsaE [bacterium]